MFLGEICFFSNLFLHYWDKLSQYCVWWRWFLNQGNVGLIFTRGDLKEVSEEVAKYKVRFTASRFRLRFKFIIISSVSTAIWKKESSINSFHACWKEFFSMEGKAIVWTLRFGIVKENTWTFFSPICFPSQKRCSLDGIHEFQVIPWAGTWPHFK